MIDEKRIQTTPVQHIRNLMESIKDGKLAITYYDPIEPPYSRVFDVSCTADDTDEVVSKYIAIENALESHHEGDAEQRLKHLPTKGYSPSLLANRAKRYEYCIQHNAPKTVIDEEGRCLAEEMILYHYCIKEIS